MSSRHHASHSEQLFESDHGFVRYCRNCASFELRFGNAIMGLSPADLTDLCEMIAQFDVESPERRAPDEHSVVWVGNSGAGFRFTRPEISELNRLLSGATLFAELNRAP